MERPPFHTEKQDRSTTLAVCRRNNRIETGTHSQGVGRAASRRHIGFGTRRNSLGAEFAWQRCALQPCLRVLPAHRTNKNNPLYRPRQAENGSAKLSRKRADSNERLQRYAIGIARIQRRSIAYKQRRNDPQGVQLNQQFSCHKWNIAHSGDESREERNRNRRFQACYAARRHSNGKVPEVAETCR